MNSEEAREKMEDIKQGNDKCLQYWDLFQDILFQ